MNLFKLTRRQACVIGVGAFVAGHAAAATSPNANAEADALHLLNRLAYGPAPGELARVMQIGAPAYIDEQLHPERLAMPQAFTRSALAC